MTSAVRRHVIRAAILSERPARAGEWGDGDEHGDGRERHDPEHASGRLAARRASRCTSTSGGFAAGQAEAIVRRLSRLREGLEEALEIRDLPAEPIAIYLADLPDEAPGGGPGAIRVLCTPDTPAGALEGLALERMLRAGCGLRASNAAFMVEGLLGNLAGVSGEVDIEAISAGLAQKQRRGELLRLGMVVKGPPGADAATYRAQATSFVSWLLSTKGAGTFRTFVRDLDPARADETTKLVYAQSALGPRSRVARRHPGGPPQPRRRRDDRRDRFRYLRPLPRASRRRSWR